VTPASDLVPHAEVGAGVVDRRSILGRTVEHVEHALGVGLHETREASNIRCTTSPVSSGVYSKNT